MTLIKAGISTFVVTCSLVFGSATAGSADEQAANPIVTANTSSSDITEAESSQAKSIFAGQCGWCHGSYGMTADKGPRLAGTRMSEQEVQLRIRNGKPGYMPSFHRFLNDQQIALMARYIKSLKPSD